jgi:hypothetical protein
VAEAIEGGFHLAMPIMAATGVAAPLLAAEGLALGYGTSKAAKYGTKRSAVVLKRNAWPKTSVGWRRRRHYLILISRLTLRQKPQARSVQSLAGKQARELL